MVETTNGPGASFGASGGTDPLAILVDLVATAVAAKLGERLNAQQSAVSGAPTHLRIIAAAERCGLPSSAIRAAIARGEVPCARTGHRTVLIAVADLDSWLTRRTIPARPPSPRLRAVRR